VGSRSRGLRRMCVLAAVVASVAGCVGMPSNGPAEQLTASPQSSAPEGNLSGPFASGPQPNEDPSHIVQGFLIASASYPTNSVADEYLVSSAVKGWNPDFAVTVFSQLNVPNPAPAAGTGRGAAQQTTVDVTGTVQASFNGSGQQYVSAAQSPGQAAGDWLFYLVKVNGQWRIKNPPDYRMLTADDFPFFYKAQDLYFFDAQDQLLVPDSVFVPLGATALQQIHSLVNALTAGPKTLWLEGAADTELPPDAKVQDVTIDGSTVTVDLSGQVAMDNPKLALFAAQLVWTLTGPPPNPIQSVVLNLNGQQWTPHSPPCTDGPNPGLFQTLAAYQCYDPYPSSPKSFYYVDRGQTWGRCGSESLGLQGFVGPAEPVVSRTGVLTSQSCDVGGSVREGYATLPSLQPPSLPAVSMAAVSPDGRYLAVVSAKGAVYVGTLSGQAASLADTPRLTGGGVTALSWDRNDNLWVAQNGDIVMLPASGKGQVTVAFDGTVSDLSVAPDGVRIAFIGQPAGSSGSGLFLAAIGGGQEQANGQLGSPTAHLSIRAYATLGPNLTDPASIAWYNADNLIALNDAAAGNSLWEVPVDGQQASPAVTPPDVVSITADGAANVLVAGLSGGNLAVSTSLEGPWNQLGEPGQAPAYPG
jgi:hypothetical protein